MIPGPVSDGEDLVPEKGKQETLLDTFAESVCVQKMFTKNVVKTSKYVVEEGFYVCIILQKKLFTHLSPFPLYVSRGKKKKISPSLSSLPNFICFSYF